MNQLRNSFPEAQQASSASLPEPAPPRLDALRSKFKQEAVVSPDEMRGLTGGRTATRGFFDLQNSCGAVLPL